MVDVIDLVSSSPPKVCEALPKPNKTPAAPPIYNTNFTTYPNAKRTASEWYELSDDCDFGSSIDVSALPTLPTLKPSSTIGSSTIATESIHQPSKVADRNHDDFFILSDDFDSHIDIDQSFDLGVSAKKRKLSPARTDVRRSSPILLDGPPKPITKAKGLGRSVSGVVDRPNDEAFTRRGSLRRSKTTIEHDPIVWTSSPDFVRDTARRKKTSIDEILSSDPFASPIDRISSSKPTTGAKAFDLSSRNSGVHKGIRIDDHDYSSDFDLPDVKSIAPAQQASSGAVPLKRKTSEAILAAYNAEKAAEKKKREKTVDKEEKLATKEAEKTRKRLEKEEKAREKIAAAELAKVNTLRTDKKVSTPEMIVDLPEDMDAVLKESTKALLKKLNVEHYERKSQVPNVVRWRRKVQAEYNEEMDHWEPCRKHIKDEKHVLCVMAAQEFVDFTTADEGHDLDAHVLRMKSKFEDSEIIYLIEGLSVWMRKNRAVRNKQFTDAVRNTMRSEDDTTSTSSKRASKKKVQVYADEDMVEDSLLKLQIVHGVLIHHTAASIETAQWIGIFTQHISTAPYRYGSTWHSMIPKHLYID
jgi:crossover junction endonuclease EME1